MILQAVMMSLAAFSQIVVDGCRKAADNVWKRAGSVYYMLYIFCSLYCLYPRNHTQPICQSGSPGQRCLQNLPQTVRMPAIDCATLDAWPVGRFTTIRDARPTVLLCNHRLRRICADARRHSNGHEAASIGEAARLYA